MNTQIAQITQSLAANGCAYITPSDALYDEQDWELMNQVLANSTLPWEKILIGDADEENDLYVARFMTDRDRPTVVNHALSELIIPRVCNDNVMSLFRKLMGDDAFYVRRMQVNRMKAGSFIGRHLDTDSNPDYQYSIVLQLRHLLLRRPVRGLRPRWQPAQRHQAGAALGDHQRLQLSPRGPAGDRRRARLAGVLRQSPCGPEPAGLLTRRRGDSKRCRRTHVTPGACPSAACCWGYWPARSTCWPSRWASSTARSRSVMAWNTRGGSPGTPPASRISARRTWRTAISCSATATPGIACGRWSSPAAMPAGRSPKCSAPRPCRWTGSPAPWASDAPPRASTPTWTRPRASCCNATATGSTPIWGWPRRRCRWNSAWCATNGRGLGGRWTACPCTCSIPGP